MKRYIIIFLCLVAGFSYAQQSAPLNRAVGASANYLSRRLERNSKVALMGFRAQTPELSEYLLEEITAAVVNGGLLTVVDRRNLEALQQELNFQLSGEVSDETAQSIGKILGAQYIVSGSISPLGNLYRLRVQAIAVETAQIRGMVNLNVTPDPILASLLGDKFQAPPPDQAPPQAPAREPSPRADDVLAKAREMISEAPPAVNRKPARRVPLRPGNFEVIQGNSRYIRPPIDRDKFYAAAVRAMREENFVIEKSESGSITFRHSGGDWWVRIKLCYWTDEYWFEYVDSYNLRSDPARNRIHRNYYDWIENLEDELEDFYR